MGKEDIPISRYECKVILAIAPETIAMVVAGFCAFLGISRFFDGLGGGGRRGGGGRANRND